jgi:hypothetical protein
MESCLVTAGWFCGRWDATISFWDLLVTVLFTGLVTWLTIWAATRSAREATITTLRHASDLHRDALQQAERTSRWQARMSEVIALRGAVEATLDAAASGASRDKRDESRRLMADAETRMRISLSPAGPELLRVLEFELQMASRAPQPDEKPGSFIVETLARRQKLVELIEAWGRDPDSEATDIVRRAIAVDRFNDDLGRALLSHVAKANAAADDDDPEEPT